MELRRALPVLLALLLLGGCGRKGAEGAAEQNAPEPSSLLEPGENPLWFELGPQGPVPIASPEEASMPPYSPWPLARHIAAVIAWGDAAVMASNREGFLILKPAGDRLLLARAPASCDPYTMGALFLYEGMPAIFLYRDDFFIDPLAPPPLPPVLVLDEGRPRALELAALANGEARGLRQSPGGLWYIKTLGEQRPVYFRTGDLAAPGEEVDLAEWLAAAEPEPPEAAPLGALLSAAFALSDDAAGAEILCLDAAPGLPQLRTFRAPAGGSAALLGFYRAGEGCVILPSGRGFYAAGGPPSPFSLPPLPEGFFYTALVPAGSALAAAWEEQEGAAIAAAGFLVIKPE